MDKKVIGYKAPFDIYTDIFCETIQKGEMLIPCGLYYRKRKKNCSDPTYYIAKEIVENTWEAVYQEDEVILNIGNPRQSVVINSRGITCDNKTMSFSDFQVIQNRVKNVHSNLTWSINVTEIKIGCSTFNIEEFDQVVEVSKKFI